jgi:hypothetical protein
MPQRRIRPAQPPGTTSHFDPSTPRVLPPGSAAPPSGQRLGQPIDEGPVTRTSPIAEAIGPWPTVRANGAAVLIPADARHPITTRCRRRRTARTGAVR